MNQRTWTALAFVLHTILNADGLRAQSSMGLDINDVAVLFPLDANAHALPDIPLASARGHTFITAETYAQLLKAAKVSGIAAPFPNSLESASDWSIVAYRIDPCAPAGNNGPRGPCAAELRIVAQPKSPANANGPSDTALHLIYAIDDIATNVYAEVMRLKSTAESQTFATTNGKPLGVHPLLLLSAMNGSKEVPILHQDFLKKFAIAKRLKKVTIMGLRDAFALDWIFLGGDVQEGDWRQGEIPNLEKGHNAFVEFDLRNDPNPFTIRPIDNSLSTFDFFTAGSDTAPETLKNLGEAAHRLENPDLSNRNTADCLSCHSATTMRIHPIAAMPFYIKGLTAKIPRGITGFPEPLSLQNHDLNWNLRALGYFNQRPTLAMRTVIEAARSADMINTILKRKNPGPDCEAVEAEVVSCFAKTSTPRGPQKSTEECLELCINSKD